MKETESLFADALRKKANELKALPEGWDSYSAPAPDPESIDKALELALAAAPFFTHAPSLVPLNNGGACVEWHTDGWDIEMVVEKHDWSGKA